MMLRFFILLGIPPFLFASTLGDCFLEQNSQKVDLKRIKEIYRIEKKINGDHKDILGTPLYLAAKSGSLPIVTFLVKHGANVNKANGSSDIPLHVAAAYGHLEIVKYLVKHKARINKKNSIGKNALELAKLRERTSVVNYLQKFTSNKKRRNIIKKRKSIKRLASKHKGKEGTLQKIETFQNLPYVQTLGVVSQSQPYVTEKRVTATHNHEINNVIYTPKQNEESYEHLPFVKSLEIVTKSKPYIESKS